jgi:hypothetical protein
MVHTKNTARISRDHVIIKISYTVAQYRHWLTLYIRKG